MQLSLPKWLSLEQAAEWLTDKAKPVGHSWTAESLLGDICTALGPLSNIRELLPVWFDAGKRGLLVVEHSTLQRLYVKATIDSGAVKFIGDGTAGLKPGTEVSRSNFVVQGMDLFRFMQAYGRAADSAQAAPLDVAGSLRQIPAKWNTGLKLVAYECAIEVYEASSKLTGAALWAAIAKDRRVTVTSTTARFSTADESDKGGEAQAEAKTIKGDWRQQLKKLLSGD